MNSQHYFNISVKTIFLKSTPELSVCHRERQCNLEVVHQAVLTASLLADGEVVAQRAGGIGAVHRVTHCVVVVAGGVPDDAGACRRRNQHKHSHYCENRQWTGYLHCICLLQPGR